MMVALALVEAGAIFAALCVSAVVGEWSVPGGWRGVAVVEVTVTSETMQFESTEYVPVNVN